MINSALTRALCGLALVVVVGCDESEPLAPSDKPSPDLAVSRGEVAFLAECASCHAARDGFDLAFFQFPDTTIVRRAVGHVTKPTANDIVDYIRSLNTSFASRHARPLQPGEGVLSDDRSFAMGLFGMDGIPADLNTDVLRQIDPLAVSVAVPFPEWSIEARSPVIAWPDTTRTRSPRT